MEENNMEQNLKDKWELITEDNLELEAISATDEFKHLIFDTYQFLESVLTEKGDIPRKLLTLYKYIAKTQMYLSINYLYNVPHSVSSSYSDCCEGLCHVFEKGFNNGYYEHSLPLGLTRHTPAGCASPEADMSSFESFLRSFDDNVDLLHDYYGEDTVT